MTNKAFPTWFLVAIVLIAISFFLGKCSGSGASSAAEEARKAAEARADSLAVAHTATLQRDSIKDIKYGKDTIRLWGKIDSISTAKKIDEIKHDEYRHDVKEKLNDLNGAIAAGDTGKLRPIVDDLSDKLKRADQNITDWQGLSNTKDSLLDSLTRLQADLIASKNKTIDTLSKNFIGMQGLYSQLALASKPHTVVSGGFNIWTGGGQSGVGPTLQLTSKAGSSYQISLDYTTAKSGYINFTWLSPIRLKR